MDGLPLVREGFPRTVRLVSSARLREAVMTPLADSADELALLAEIEGATSGRLVAEERGSGALSAAELVHGVPHAKFINASFAYAKPREPMRFSPAERGAWYAALAAETCIAEVGHHLTGDERWGPDEGLGSAGFFYHPKAADRRVALHSWVAVACPSTWSPTGTPTAPGGCGPASLYMTRCSGRAAGACSRATRAETGWRKCIRLQRSPHSWAAFHLPSTRPPDARRGSRRWLPGFSR